MRDSTSGWVDRRWVRGLFHIKECLTASAYLLLLSSTLIAAELPHPLTQIIHVRELSPQRAAEGLPVQMETVVTYSDPSGQVLFVRDETGAIFVEAAQAGQFHPGQRLTILGQTAAGSFTPIIRAGQLTPGPVAGLPTPRPASWAELQSGSLDCEWLRVRGRIRSARLVERQLELILAMADGRQVAWVRDPVDLVPEQLVGAVVDLQGVCAGGRGQRNELLSFDVFASGRDDLAFVERPTGGPGELPLLPVSKLKPTTSSFLSQRTRVQGRVTLSWSGQWLFVQDESGSIQIKTRDVAGFRRGQRVEAWGFPAWFHRRPVLEDAEVRSLGVDEAPQPRPRTLKEVYSRYSHGDYISLRGRLSDVALQPVTRRDGWLDLTWLAVPTLVIESDGWFVRADFPPDVSLQQLETLERGSTLALSGVCSAELTEPEAPRSYRLLIESVEDIQVLRPAPWWTPRRFLAVVGGIAVLGVSALGWVAWFHARRRREAERIISRRSQQTIRHQAALLEISRAGGDAPRLIQRTTEIAADALQVGRASIWLFSHDHATLLCRDLFIRERREHQSGALLSVGAYPAYFAALESTLTIDASLAREDPRTREFTTAYLEPLGIQSMLDVPVRLGGTVRGAVCFEHQAEVRRWTMEEQTFAAAVADDISLFLEAEERRKAEAALRAAHAELEERVFLRTSELAEAKERAESADRVKSAFLATMSHELRTPLNSILGFTGIIHQGLVGPLNPEQKKQLGMVMNSARHLLSLINDVLDISKIEAGQVELEMKPFAVSESVARVAEMVEPLAAKKQIGLIVDISPEVGEMVSDRRRFEQILINLLNNAVKFTERGQVRVRCQRQGEQIATQIVDSGIGIKPEDLSILFKPFRQIDSGLTRHHEGTGLGLAICDRLVRMLGGVLKVESEWQQGSTFTFSLPIRSEVHP